MAGVDYSKWDKFTDEEEEGAGAGADSKTEAASKEAAAKPKRAKKPKKTMLCGNCRAEGAKLRCTVCKKVAYCNRNCQKSDWRFHKRVCKKPEKKKKDKDGKRKSSKATNSAAAPAPASASSGSSSGSGSSSSREKPAKKATSQPTQAELDAEDEEIVKSLKGYRYFHRDVSEHEAKIIGDITPELMTKTSTTGDDDDLDAPQPMVAATSTPSSLASASAWNSARTFEERDMTRWAKAHLESLLVDMSVDVADATAVIKELSDWEGDASIPVIRGRARFLYDFNFTIKLDVNSGSDTGKKATIKVVDFSQDDDEVQLELKFVSPKPSALHQAALRSVMERGSGSLRTRILATLEQFVVDFKAK